jgi:hypothetical protein
MKYQVKAGEVIETTTPEENRHHLLTAVADWFQERARGVGPWRFISAPVTVTAGHTVQIPSTSDNECGPNNGFCVLVTSIRIKGLSSGDVIKVFRNSVNGEEVDEFVMPATGTLGVIREGSRALFLNSGEQLIFTGTGLTATGDIVISAEGVECSSTDAYKVLLS